LNLTVGDLLDGGGGGRCSAAGGDDHGGGLARAAGHAGTAGGDGLNLGHVGGRDLRAGDGGVGNDEAREEGDSDGGTHFDLINVGLVKEEVESSSECLVVRLLD